MGDSQEQPSQNGSPREEEKLALEIEKLKAETENLKWNTRVGRYLPLMTALLTVFIAAAGFVWGIIQFGRQQSIEIEQLKNQFESNLKLSEKEFRRRFYERQLDAYVDLSKLAGELSTAKDPSEIEKLHSRFLQFYNGNLIIVQDAEVKRAADAFDTAFTEYTNGRLSREALQDKSRRLVRACRNSLLHIWDIRSVNRDDDFVNVSESRIKCLFSAKCTVKPSDTTDNVTLSTGGAGILQSRTFTGDAGSAAAGLYSYEYRLDLRNAVAATTISCIDSMNIEIGSMVNTFDYNEDDDPDRIFVITEGSLGTISIGSAVQTGNTLSVYFANPICAGTSGNGDSSFFWGFVSKAPPRSVTATLHETSGVEHAVKARSP